MSALTMAVFQGCAQCLDSTRATPPVVQAAYRQAIELLGGTGVMLFSGGVFLLMRSHKPYEQAETVHR